MDGNVLPPGTYVKVSGNLRSFQVSFFYYPVICAVPPPQKKFRVIAVEAAKNRRSRKNYVLHCFCADSNVPASTTHIPKDAQAIFNLLIWLFEFKKGHIFIFHTQAC